MTAHTPGPWTLTDRRVVERPVRITEHFAIAAPGAPTFAFLPRGRADIQEANARLMAASPKMLAALLRVRDLAVTRHTGEQLLLAIQEAIFEAVKV